MSKSELPASEEGPLEKGIERRRARRAEFEKEGERPLAQNLAMIGALGWLIVVPTLVGIFSGQWLDRREGTGLVFTGALMIVGLALGSWLAWQRMHRP
ncbi:MAG: AtpZ/AtpI family protein [Polyangiales bacterium]